MLKVERKKGSGLTALALLALSCGHDAGVPLATDSSTSVSGVVIGVSGGTVSVYRLNAGARGDLAGSAAAKADGSFTVNLGRTNGPLIVAASGGTMLDEASGLRVQMDKDELTALVTGDFIEGTQLQGLLVTPISHFATSRALYQISQGMAFDAAFADSWTHLNGHFGALDWRTIVPTDLTTSTTAQLTDAAKAGLILAGFSWVAASISASQNPPLSPGTVVNKLTLIEALADDVGADGLFDGMGKRGQLVLPPNVVQPYKLDGQTARSKLSAGIAAFIADRKNASHITQTDAAGLSAAIVGDVDLKLFRDAGNGPKLTVVSATFHRADAVEHPIGAAALAGGVITLTVDASSQAGVQTLNVSVGTTKVPDAPGATNTPQHFVGAWDTVAQHVEGSLTFTITAADKNGNASYLSYIVTVDNTAPALKPNTTVYPVANAFYSKAIPINATFTDPHGVAMTATLTTPTATVNLSNDGTPDHFFLTNNWPIPATQVNGPASVAYTACDQVFNCTKLTVAVGIDTLPPKVTLGQWPPYVGDQPTNNTAVLSGTVDDGNGAGVGSVVVLNNSNKSMQMPANVTGNTWTVDVRSLLLDGGNELTIFAIDTATDYKNSGQGSADPNYQVSKRVILDKTPKTITYDTGVTHFDETDMDYLPAGLSDGPFTYTYKSNTKVSVDFGIQPVGVVHKAGSRLAWGATVSDLVTGNSSNTPFLPFLISYDPANNAPIPDTGVTFQATFLQCTGACDPVGGNLIKDPLFPQASPTNKFVRFVLPVSIETMPALAQAPTRVQVTVTVLDEMVNKSATPSGQIFNFAIVSPPIHVGDASSSLKNDPVAADHFLIADGSYSGLFVPAPGNFPPEGIRQMRQDIANPNSSSAVVYIQQAQDSAPVPGATTSAAMQEGWTNSMPSAAFGPLQTFSDQPPAAKAACNASYTYLRPCSSNNVMIGGASTYTCSTIPADGSAALSQALVQGGNVLLGVYEVSSTGALRAAQPTSDAGWIVPPASRTTPGKLAAIFGRQPSTSRAISQPLTWNSSNSQFLWQYATYLTWVSGGNCPAWPPDFSNPGTYSDYSNKYWNQYLSQASEAAAVTWSVKSASIAPSNTAGIGNQKQVVPSGTKLQRTINH